jgi:hypothetical protein
MYLYEKWEKNKKQVVPRLKHRHDPVTRLARVRFASYRAGFRPGQTHADFRAARQAWTSILLVQHSCFHVSRNKNLKKKERGNPWCLPKVVLRDIYSEREEKNAALL